MLGVHVLPAIIIFIAKARTHCASAFGVHVLKRPNAWY